MSYEKKQDAKREKLRAKASKLRSESKSRMESVQLMAGVMNGTPILIGHHSEKRHRRDIERMDNNLRKSVEAQRKADRLEQRAAGIGRGGISADDENAIEKLRAKLDGLESKREAYKAHNKAAKKSGEEILPGYVLSNLGANIRSTKKRIEALSHEADRRSNTDVEPRQVGDWTIVEDHDDNRLKLSSETKPPVEHRQILKRHGFKWSPTRGAWVRQLTDNARNSATYALDEIAKQP